METRWGTAVHEQPTKTPTKAEFKTQNMKINHKFHSTHDMTSGKSRTDFDRAVHYRSDMRKCGYNSKFER